MTPSRASASTFSVHAPYLDALLEMGEARCVTALALRDEDGLVQLTPETRDAGGARVVSPPAGFRIAPDAAGERISLKTAVPRQRTIAAFLGPYGSGTPESPDAPHASRGARRLYG